MAISKKASGASAGKGASGKKAPAAKKAPAKKAPAKSAAGAKKPSAPAKKAASAKKRSLVEEWAESYRPFVERTRERFDFLVGEHGYAEPQVSVVPPECVVEYAKDGGHVQIGTEYGGVPYVSVRFAGWEPFGLHEYMEELDPAYAAERPKAQGNVLSDEQMAAALDHEATYLRRHAGAVLGGDPALLERLRQRRRAGGAAP